MTGSGSSAGACLIVGVGDGLGLALARRFALGGFDLALVARKEAELRARAATVPGDGHIVPIVADMASPYAAEAVVATTRATLGQVAVMIYNCAAIGRPRLPTALDRESALRSIEVNVLSPLVLAQLVARDMVALGRGTILFTGGTWATDPSETYAALSFTKAAQRNLAVSLAHELAPRGVHVVTVTIAGAIGAGNGKYDPAAIADQYWALHQQDRCDWLPEFEY